jgi:hypothetical protein
VIVAAHLAVDYLAITPADQSDFRFHPPVFTLKSFNNLSTKFISLCADIVLGVTEGSLGLGAHR